VSLAAWRSYAQASSRPKPPFWVFQRPKAALSRVSTIESKYTWNEVDDLPYSGRVVVFDVETTGLSNEDGVVEYGAVELINGARTGNIFQSYCKPNASVHEAAFAAHGLSDEFLKEYPSSNVITWNFVRWLSAGDAPLLVAHNAAFDMRMLHNEMLRARITLPTQLTTFCTMKYFKKKVPGHRFSLDALRDYFGLEIQRDLHGALLDSEITAKVFQKLFLLN